MQYCVWILTPYFSGGFEDKGTHFVEGGDAGNREEFINALLNRMI